MSSPREIRAAERAAAQEAYNKEIPSSWLMTRCMACGEYQDVCDVRRRRCVHCGRRLASYRMKGNTMTVTGTGETAQEH